MSETPRGSQVAHKMAVLVVVVLVFAGLLSIVMPSLKQAKLMSQKARMRSEDREAYYDKATDSPPAAPRAGGGEVAGLPGVLAHVKSFVADITLTPQLSIGTERPQSIWLKMRGHSPKGQVS